MDDPIHKIKEAMFNLFVSSNEKAWDGEPWVIDADRCLNESEHTDPDIVHRYGELTPEIISELTHYPCVFAFETICKLDAKLGRLLRVRRKNGEIRVEYEIDSGYPSIAHNDLIRLEWELDISKWELNRTHWALKNESLSEALTSIGYPEIGSSPQMVDIHRHTFDVALSFPGEIRSYVELVANSLVTTLGRHHVFYDNFYKAQLAQPNLDLALQRLYKDRARLIVAFLSNDYASKRWCHIEFRAIKEIINSKEDNRVMFVRHDGAEVPGVFSADGYIDATQHNPNEVAEMICERVALLQAGGGA